MADVIKNETSYKFLMQFVDGDTRTLNMKNPKTLTTSEIENFETYMQTNQVVIGDQNNAAFGKFKKVTSVTTQTRYLDINS